MKEIKVKIGEKEITVKGVTVLQHFKIKAERIQFPEIPAWFVFLKNCINEEDLKYLDTIDSLNNKEISDKLFDAVGEIMGLFKKESDVQDFQKQA